jgi:YD repeat-containing protein
MARRRRPEDTTPNASQRPAAPVAVVGLSSLRWTTDILKLRWRLWTAWRTLQAAFDRLRPRRSRSITYYYDRQGRLRACVGPHGTSRWEWDADDPSQATRVTMTQN